MYVRVSQGCETRAGCGAAVAWDGGRVYRYHRISSSSALFLSLSLLGLRALSHFVYVCMTINTSTRSLSATHFTWWLHMFHIGGLPGGHAHCFFHICTLYEAMCLMFACHVAHIMLARVFTS
ncbi:hypothetical protein F5B17DRAFT_380084 [Nemania serpens]|nr:hypothetical protein F5B17DRAFT_380084 [Nemania serpens]